MLALINGEEVALPKFDFTTNEITFGKKIKIDDKTPIIIEGIHALNDKLSYAIPRHQKFKIFIVLSRFFIIIWDPIPVYSIF